MNGGNAETPRDDSNLEISGTDATLLTESQNSACKTPPIVGGNADAQELNGDLKASSRKPGAPTTRRKLRKFKTNSTGTVEIDMEIHGTRGRKRKLSELDGASSEDSMEFTGFDLQGIGEIQPASHVLKKLIGTYYSWLLIFMFHFATHGRGQYSIHNENIYYSNFLNVKNYDLNIFIIHTYIYYIYIYLYL